MIEQFMKDNNARLLCGDRWLFSNPLGREWVVVEPLYGHRDNAAAALEDQPPGTILLWLEGRWLSCLYSGPDLDKALKALGGEE